MHQLQAYDLWGLLIFKKADDLKRQIREALMLKIHNYPQSSDWQLQAAFWAPKWDLKLQRSEPSSNL